MPHTHPKTPQVPSHMGSCGVASPPGPHPQGFLGGGLTLTDTPIRLIRKNQVIHVLMGISVPQCKIMLCHGSLSFFPLCVPQPIPGHMGHYMHMDVQM